MIKGEIAQKTEDLVGPYELHDFFLYYVLRCGFALQNLLDGTECLSWSLSRQRHSPLDAHFLSQVLLPAIQAFMLARRTKGGQRESFTTWRLENAF